MESLVILLIILVIIGMVKGMYYRRKISKLSNELDEVKRNERHMDSIFKMTTYHIKGYKEWVNPYTTMSKIVDLYRDEL